MDARLALLEGAVPPTIGFHIRGGDKGEEDVLRVKMLPTPSSCMLMVHHALGVAPQTCHVPCSWQRHHCTCQCGKGTLSYTNIER